MMHHHQQQTIITNSNNNTAEPDFALASGSLHPSEHQSPIHIAWHQTISPTFQRESTREMSNMFHHCCWLGSITLTSASLKRGPAGPLYGLNDWEEVIENCALNWSMVINPIQSNPIRSDPIQSNPIQSNPIQSNPIQSNPIDNEMIHTFQFSLQIVFWFLQCTFELHPTIVQVGHSAKQWLDSFSPHCKSSSTPHHPSCPICFCPADSTSSFALMNDKCAHEYHWSIERLIDWCSLFVS